MELIVSNVNFDNIYLMNETTIDFQSSVVKFVCLSFCFSWEYKRISRSHTLEQFWCSI